MERGEMPLPMEKSEIISIIDEHLSEKTSAVEINQVREFDLRDRMVRVEEALKYQGEQFRMLISQMDSFMRWSFGTTLSAVGIIIAVMKIPF